MLKYEKIFNLEMSRINEVHHQLQIKSCRTDLGDTITSEITSSLSALIEVNLRRATRAWSLSQRVPVFKNF